MKRVLRLYGNKIIGKTPTDWHALAGKRILNGNVYLGGFGDIQPFPNSPVFTAEKVVMDLCDKNFVYYWFNKETFPNIKNIYLASHPCEPSVLRNNEDINIFLLDRFSKYAGRWAPDRYIRVITRDELDYVLSGEDEHMLTRNY
jgi:hypothetical protein